jgi:hypothetical protein
MARRDIAAAACSGSARSLEVLHGAFVTLGLRTRPERTEITPPARLRVLPPRVKAIGSGR